jgi:hypothetical protein
MSTTRLSQAVSNCADAHLGIMKVYHCLVVVRDELPNLRRSISSRSSGSLRFVKGRDRRCSNSKGRQASTPAMTGRSEQSSMVPRDMWCKH